MHYSAAGVLLDRSLRIAVLLAMVAVSTTADADVFRILDDPADALQARVDIIQQAGSEIHALYFLARDDRVTLGALALLREARGRGVGSVKLIVDANFSHIPKAVLAHLRDEGVHVRVYHPLTLRHPSWLFRRMHEKVVIVDGARYIAGGRNLAEAYFGLAKKNYVDRDVYVEGASALDADRHFENLWNSRHVADLDVRVTDWDKEQAEVLLTAALGELSDVIALHTGTRWSEGQKDAGTVRFLHDPVSAKDGPRVAQSFMEILENAKTAIVIESPYLVPSKTLLQLFERKLREGVAVTVLTNSLRSCDGVLPQAGYLKYRRRLLRSGIDLREYRGPDMLHAKTAVVDGRVVMVGSYNLDPRSQNWNTEAICVAEDETVAREVLASIDAHFANAWTVGSASRGPREGRSQRFRAWAARLLLPLIENQL